MKSKCAHTEFPLLRTFNVLEVFSDNTTETLILNEKDIYYGYI